jgi:hypothetical protein
MVLVRLTYASQGVKELHEGDLQAILGVARSNNKQQHITGMLTFDSNYFLQCIEGPRANVCQLLSKIMSDPRHNDVRLLEFTDIDERSFGDWTMGYVPSSRLTAPINLKFSKSDRFRPFELTGKGARLLLLELKKHIETI